MKQLSMWFKFPVILALCLGLIYPGLTALAKAEDKLEIKDLAKSNTQFAVDLYAKLKAQPGNLFFSPYSISTALAMTYAGAKGNTEQQMASVLHFPLTQDTLHQKFASLQQELNQLGKNGTIELSISNALWAQENHVFLKEFLDLTNKYYNAGLKKVDFKIDPEKARLEINNWVAKETKDKIQDLIQPGMLNKLTRLVLTNAIYFKGKWLSQFDKNITQDAQFWLSKGTSLKVPMMHKQAEFNYAEAENLQILELLYMGKELSMVILLPKQIDGLGQLEANLNAKNIDSWIFSLKRTEVIVSLPKFKMTSSFELGQTLSSMGMPDAFGPKANFSGMDGEVDLYKKLYISAVIHKAFADCNEEGTEAAAATAVVMQKLAAIAETHPIFEADHPFIFLIRHRPSGSILFIGRVTNPKE
jgi:serpin B